jgi:hypothetical protein
MVHAKMGSTASRVLACCTSSIVHGSCCGDALPTHALSRNL